MYKIGIKSNANDTRATLHGEISSAALISICAEGLNCAIVLTVKQSR